MTEYIHFAGGVRVTKHPDSRGYFRIRFTKRSGAPGEARRRTWEDAEALARELSGLAVRQVEHHPPLADASIADLAEAWLGLDWKHSFVQSARSMARVNILPVVGKLRCKDWDEAASRRVVEAARERGLAESTVGNLVQCLRSMAKAGRELGYLAPDCHPAKDVGVKGLTTEIDLTELPDHDDVDKIAAALVEVTSEPWRGLQVYVAAYSGLRAGEMLGLKVGDIDLDDGTIRVDRQLGVTSNQLDDPKYGSKRTTVFPVFLDDAYAELVDGRDPDAPAFPSRTGLHELYSTFSSQRWGPATSAAGWRVDGRSRWTYHDLRHHFCTWALSKEGLNLDVADVSRFAGHKSVQTTWATYVQSRPDRVSRARRASRGAGR